MGDEFTVNFGRPPQGIDPDSYAKQYANEKGITLTEAKAELKAKYGDPQQPRGMSMNAGLPGLQFSGQGATLGFNPYGGIPHDPAKLGQFIENGARQAGCTPQEFAQMMGIPPKSNLNSSNTSVNTASSITISSNTYNRNYTSYNDIKSDAEDIYRSNVKYETTRSERKDIKKQTNNYIKQLETYQKEYIKAHRDNYKSASSRSERKSLKAQVYKDAEQYAIEKFKHEYPNVDLSTVFYNSRENMTGQALFSHPNLKPYN